jgi:hypothetical protein
MPLTNKRRLAAILYLILFTNAASWVFFFASYPQLRARLPALLQSPNFWFFAFWYPIVFFGIAIFSTNNWSVKFRLFLTGYLSISLFHNCLWRLLFNVFGCQGFAFSQNLGPLKYQIPFFSLIKYQITNSSLNLQFPSSYSILFVFVGILIVYSRSSKTLLLGFISFLLLIFDHFYSYEYIHMACIAAIWYLFPGTFKEISEKYNKSRSLWDNAFHPMLAIFAFIISVCIFCFATFRGGLLWADLTLYDFTYPVVIITIGYAMVGDWHPFRNFFERAKLFLAFWLFEAIFYDWSWWLAYILFGEPFKWSAPFYVDILLPFTTMATFLIVALLNFLIGIYTLFFVRTPRGLIPVFSYFLILFVMIMHKLLLGKSSWTFALCTYGAAIVLGFLVDRIYAVKHIDRH